SERGLDRVREHVSAADHGHPEHDRGGGQDRPQLPAEQALQCDARHELRLLITASTSSAVASVSCFTINPSAMKRIRSAIAAARGSWVTITVVCPYASTESRIRSRISPPVFESRLPVGSSANRIVGRV